MSSLGVSPPLLLLDGAMGLELKSRKAQGCKNVAYDLTLFSTAALRETPDAVYDLHLDYCRAGADVITTASYAITRWYLGKIGKAHEVPDLARLSIRLAKQAVSDFMSTSSSSPAPLVAASVPPLGESYHEAALSVTEMTEQYDELLGALRGADVYLCETMSTIDEATLAASRCRRLYPESPLWMSFHPRRATTTSQQDDEASSCRPTDSVDPTSTSPPSQGVCIARDGKSIREAVEAAISAGADAVLFNCATPEIIGACIREASAAAAAADAAAAHASQGHHPIRVGGYGNFWEEADTGPGSWSIERNESDAGARDQKSGGFVLRDITPRQYSDMAREWISTGASIVGGCCGFGPEVIAAVGRQAAIGRHSRAP